MLNKQYIITSTCLITRGEFRSVIYDLQKYKYDFVPNAVNDFLQSFELKSFEEIYKDTELKYKGIVKEYLEYCLEREYILFIPKDVNKDRFPKLDLKFDSPAIISNISFKLSDNLTLANDKIKDIIIVTKCQNIQLILEKEYIIENIFSLLNCIAFIGLRSIEIITKYKNNYDYTLITKQYKNISFIYLYSAPKNEFLKFHVLGLQQIFSSINDFEITYDKSLEFFNVNIALFTESQKHNTYFNSKLHIDTNGAIKNAPLAKTVFGNVYNLTNTDEILAIINTKEFQKYWYVHKDLIDVCKQCEFRHMCVDNRIPKQRSNNEWYMETECNYNPYIAKWNNEDGYKSLSECGVVSNQVGFKINRKKISEINKVIWGDE